MSTRPLHSVAAATKKTEKVEHGNLLFASQNSIFAVRVAGKTQQCRAHLKGRCNMGATCFESHDTPESEIICCSKLAKDDPLWHKNFTKCRTSPRATRSELDKSGMPLEDRGHN